jgi:hypothetical protein
MDFQSLQVLRILENYATNTYKYQNCVPGTRIVASLWSRKRTWFETALKKHIEYLHIYIYICRHFLKYFVM